MDENAGAGVELGIGSRVFGEDKIEQAVTVQVLGSHQQQRRIPGQLWVEGPGGLQFPLQHWQPLDGALLPVQQIHPEQPAAVHRHVLPSRTIHVHQGEAGQVVGDHAPAEVIEQARIGPHGQQGVLDQAACRILPQHQQAVKAGHQQLADPVVVKIVNPGQAGLQPAVRHREDALHGQADRRFAPEPLARPRPDLHAARDQQRQSRAAPKAAHAGQAEMFGQGGLCGNMRGKALARLAKHAHRMRHVTAQAPLGFQHNQLRQAVAVQVIGKGIGKLVAQRQAVPGKAGLLLRPHRHPARSRSQQHDHQQLDRQQFPGVGCNARPSRARWAVQLVSDSLGSPRAPHAAATPFQVRGQRVLSSRLPAGYSFMPACPTWIACEIRLTSSGRVQYFSGSRAGS